MTEYLVLCQRDYVIDDFVELQRHLMRHVLLSQRTDMADDFARSPAFADHLGHAGPHLVRLRCGMIKPSYTGLAVCNDCSERLAYFMSDGRAELPERCQACDTSKFRLRLMQLLLRLFGRCHVHYRAYKLQSARFIRCSVRHNVEVPDGTVGHLKPMLQIKVLPGAGSVAITMPGSSAGCTQFAS